MKRLFSFFVLLTLLLFSLPGCKEASDMEVFIDKLEAAGWNVSKTYSSEQELENISAVFNTEIGFTEGDFRVKIVGGTILTQGGDASADCRLYEFENEQQAKKYTELYLSDRTETSSRKIARGGALVIITDSDAAAALLELSFS